MFLSLARLLSQCILKRVVLTTFHGFNPVLSSTFYLILFVIEGAREEKEANSNQMTNRLIFLYGYNDVLL